MNPHTKKETKILAAAVAVFLLIYYLPIGSHRFDRALLEALHLVRWYAREHVLLCLIPAFFIAGAVGVFLSQAAVMRRLGPQANKSAAYAVASVSGTILAVCSCSVLPLFAGIYRMGAGLGPAVAFLYAGPAVNILALVLTARILGIEMGVARAVGAILFSILIGLIMAFLFRREETRRVETLSLPPVPPPTRPLAQTLLYFALMIGFLVVSSCCDPAEGPGMFRKVWINPATLALALGVVLVCWFGLPWWKAVAAAAPPIALNLILPGWFLAAYTAGLVGFTLAIATQKGELSEWAGATWGFARQILPLLLLGVAAAGFLFGRPGEEGLIPADWVHRMVGGNSLGANLFAAVVGAFMYFATLTEVPILQGLMESGMGKGPALALLLAGPAVSLPNLLVIRSILGNRKTLVFTGLVIAMAAFSGLLYGALF